MIGPLATVTHFLLGGLHKPSLPNVERVFKSGTFNGQAQADASLRIKIDDIPVGFQFKHMC
jgi:hypothetical protein